MCTDLEILIIVDSLAYKNKEGALREHLLNMCKPEFFYTCYENKIIVFFHKMPFLGSFFSHMSYWWLSFNSALILFTSKKKYQKKIFINPIVAIFYCLFTRLFNRKEKIIIAGFLFEQKKNKWYINLRKWFVNYCYKYIYKIIVYSKQEVKVYNKLFPSLSSKFCFVAYGKDYDIYHNIPYESEITYVATGGGSNRDFKTLLKAFNLLESKHPDLNCKIATRPNALGINSSQQNVEVLYNIRIEKFGGFLASSIFVVIPLINTPLSAGHMVLLEAMYKGKIILIADLSSIRDYVNEDSVFFYSPENVQNLADKIEFIYKNLNAKEVLQKGINANNNYSSHYSFAALLKRMVSEM